VGRSNHVKPRSESGGESRPELRQWPTPWEYLRENRADVEYKSRDKVESERGEREKQLLDSD
jgi:hypothetical protein